MKMNYLLVLIGMVFNLSAFGYYTKGVLYTDFIKSAKSAAESVRNADSCSLKVELQPFGHALILKTRTKSVRVLVTALDVVKLEGKDESDGSFQHNYTIEGKGELFVENADDAYNLVELYDSKTRTRLECRVDY